MSRRYSAVLFDKDGTLLDFARSWAPISRRAATLAARGHAALVPALLRACGQDPDTDRFAPGSPMVSGTAADVADCWLPLLPGADVDALTDLIDAVFTEGARQVVPVEGLHRTIAALRAAGLRIGLATSDNEESARQTLEHLGLINDFDFICGWDSGHGTKPGPGMALAFCAATGLHPSGVVMVGDSLHDLHMATAAGLGLRVAVLTGPATAEQLADHADLVLQGIHELPLHIRGPGSPA